METGVIIRGAEKEIDVTIRLALALALVLATQAQAAPKAVIVNEADVMRREPPPHGAIGMSTAYRMSDAVPWRTMEFRKRVLHRDAAIGLHPLGHDEVYYVLAGQGEVTSDGVTTRIGPGTAAYLYHGANVGVRQVGPDDLTLIVAYPLPKP